MALENWLMAERWFPREYWTTPVWHSARALSKGEEVGDPGAAPPLVCGFASVDEDDGGEDVDVTGERVEDVFVEDDDDDARDALVLLRRFLLFFFPISD